MGTFRKELIELINKHSKENDSNTPDFILADYLIGCLNAFDKTIQMRESWYGRNLTVNQNIPITAAPPSVSDEELQQIANFLNSEKGKDALKKAFETSNAVCDAIDNMRNIDWKILREPFTI